MTATNVVSIDSAIRASSLSLLTRQWLEWQLENPDFYPSFFRPAALAQIKKGAQRMSVNDIFEALRLRSNFSSTTESWKLNQNYRAYYVRLFLTEFPQHAERFRMRTQKYPVPASVFRDVLATL